MFFEALYIHRFRSGLIQGWSWSAYPLAPAWVQSGKNVVTFFMSSPPVSISNVVTEANVVTGTAPFINFTMPSTAKGWNGTSWKSNFYVTYTGFLAVTLPGTYGIYLTSSVGGAGSRCYVNGVPIVFTQFINGALTTVLYTGAAVRAHAPLSFSPWYHNTRHRLLSRHLHRCYPRASAK